MAVIAHRPKRMAKAEGVELGQVECSKGALYCYCYYLLIHDH